MVADAIILTKPISGGGGGSDLEVQDEGVSLSTAVTKFNFVGSGVTATEPVGDEITVTVPGTGITGLALTIINGQPMLTVEDSTRSDKILSVGEQEITWAENKLKDQDWIEIGKAGDAETGYIADFDGTIVYGTAHCENTGINSKNIRIYIDGVDTALLGNLSGGANAEINNTTLDVDFSQGQKIRLRAVNGGGGDIQDTVIKLTVKWRG